MDYNVNVPFSVQENRFFRIYSPQPGMPPNLPLPALFIFHPPHSNAFDFANETELVGFANLAGAVIVALQGINCNGDGFVWADSIDTLNPVIHDSYLDTVFATINQAHSNLIDWQRCYATGQSTGGSMALHFALFTDNQVAGSAVVGPKRFDSSSPVLNRPAVMLAHDIDDFEIPVTNSTSITASLVSVLGVDSMGMRKSKQMENFVWVTQDHPDLEQNRTRLRFIVLLSDNPGMWPNEMTHGLDFNYEMWQFFGEQLNPYQIQTTRREHIETKQERSIALLPPWPNPSNSQVTVPIQNQTAESVFLALYDITGRIVVITETELLAEGIQMLTIDVDHLASGTYFLQLLLRHQPVAERRITVVK